MSASPQRPLIAHVIYRLDFGGLENGLVNLINNLPPDRFRHAVICLTEASDFRRRIRRADVPVIEIRKRPGLDPAHYLRLWRALRTLRPQILHTRNLAALECQWLAFASGVPARIHGEHGWDLQDIDGTRMRNRLLRRVTALAVHRFVAMSKHIAAWLAESVRIDPARITQIYNGVDLRRFGASVARAVPLDFPWRGTDQIVVGTVGRMSPVKDQLTLVRAFLLLQESQPELALRLRLVLVGDGPLLEEARVMLDAAGAAQRAWLPGARDDIPELLACMQLFVLPSLNEGISNTILEAMAVGLPVIATRVGGNAELVQDGVTGRLVNAAAPDELAQVIAAYAADAELRRAHGAAGALRVERQFSLDRMVEDYTNLYQSISDAQRPAGVLRRAGE
jgi:sugar transferase (PEP-CTERM/EpsH1 system associated)